LSSRCSSKVECALRRDANLTHLAPASLKRAAMPGGMASTGSRRCRKKEAKLTVLGPVYPD